MLMVVLQKLQFNVVNAATYLFFKFYTKEFLVCRNENVTDTIPTNQI